MCSNSRVANSSLELTHIEKGSKNENGRVVSPESVPIHLNYDNNNTQHRYSPSINTTQSDTQHRLLKVFFSSPGQSPGRAIVLPPASVLASALAKC